MNDIIKNFTDEEITNEELLELVEYSRTIGPNPTLVNTGTYRMTLTPEGRLFLAGYRAKPGMSPEAQAALDAALKWAGDDIHAGRREKFDSLYQRSLKALGAYAATLKPKTKPDIEALKAEVERTKTELAEHDIARITEGWATGHDKLCVAYSNAKAALAAATAPPKPNRLELAEAVCREVLAYEHHIDIKDGILDAIEAWKAACK